MDDIDELIRSSRELAGIARLTLSVTPFVAKRYTPLDGAPFEAIRSIEQKLARLRNVLRGRVEIKPASARWAWVEYMLSQCGEEAGLLSPNVTCFPNDNYKPIYPLTLLWYNHYAHQPYRRGAMGIGVNMTSSFHTDSFLSVER